MATLADHAYTHCRALLGDDPVAADHAVLAVRRGGRSRSAVLAFARAASLPLAQSRWPASADQVLALAVPTSLPEIAPLLAATRPPVERAVVDLALRHGLDRSGVGRAYGLAPAAAAARIGAVTAAWAADLDPVLLAWLGPGDCPDLVGLLDDLAPFATVADLLAGGPAVATHVAQCERCHDRMRAMVSVPDLVGQRPLEEAPVEVGLVARRNRFRPPASAPPSIDPQRRRRWPGLAVAAGVVAGLCLIGAGTAALADRSSSQDRRNHRVAALTKVASAGALQLSPTVVRAESGALLLRNLSTHTITWQASAGASWVTLRPTSGRLAAGAVVEIVTQVTATAPEGDLRSTVTAIGDDGSATGAVVETTVEHPPTLAASIEGCSVTATAEDQGSVTSVLLHWHEAGARPADERSVAMVPGGPPGSFTGAVAATSTSWWVTAVDDRGNRALTQEEPVLSC